MQMVLMILSVAIGIVSLVCWVMTLIKTFKANIGLGILGLICPLFAFIYGWVKASEWNHKKVMLIWTLAFVVGLILQVVGGAAMFAQFSQ